MIKIPSSSKSEVKFGIAKNITGTAIIKSKGSIEESINFCILASFKLLSIDLLKYFY